MGRRLKFTQEEMKEIIKFYEEHGGRKTEKTYGLKPFYASTLICNFKYQFSRANKMSVTNFVKSSGKEMIMNFIDIFNTEGRNIACDKFKVRKNFNTDLTAVRYLLSLGLKIRKTSKVGIDSSDIQAMLDNGLSFKQIRVRLTKKYGSASICTIINRYRIEHNIDYIGEKIPNIVNNNMEYITTHTIAESCNKFGIDNKVLNTYLWEKNIKHKTDKISDLRKAVYVDIDEVRSKVKNLTLIEISKLYNTTYNATSAILSKHNIEYKKSKRGPKPNK